MTFDPLIDAMPEIYTDQPVKVFAKKKAELIIKGDHIRMSRWSMRGPCIRCGIFDRSKNGHHTGDRGKHISASHLSVKISLNNRYRRSLSHILPVEPILSLIMMG